MGCASVAACEVEHCLSGKVLASAEQTRDVPMNACGQVAVEAVLSQSFCHGEEYA
jgi:hypothetical protein